MLSPRATANRTTLMELGWRAGYPLGKILDYYPAVTSLAFEINFQTSGPYSPDDDIAVAIDGRMAYDLRRNAGVAKVPVILRPAGNVPLRVGAWVQVFTFDGWPTGISHFLWRAVITYADGTPQAIGGGSTDSWTEGEVPDPLPPGYFDNPPKRSLYFPNGHFLIPPPGNWPRPAFLPEKHHAPNASTRIQAKPTESPLFY
jgi:hypothetical protein